jgi:hypothetical protein
VLCITLFVLVDTIPWPKPTRTNNVMQNTSKNVRQYHSQNQQGQTMLNKTHRRTSDNKIAKTNKDKQCYTLVLAIVLSDVLRCVLYNIVCTCWIWLWFCLTFFDVFYITLFFLVAIPWPKPTRTNNVTQNRLKNVRQ